MRRFFVTFWVAIALGAVAGCIPDISNTNINDNDNDNNVNIGDATPTPPATPLSCSTVPVTCTRNENPQALASSFAIVHGCGEASTVICTRASDGLAVTFSAVVTGSTLDPGTAGQGGGEWTCQVVSGGSCSVRLDS